MGGGGLLVVGARVWGIAAVVVDELLELLELLVLEVVSSSPPAAGCPPAPWTGTGAMGATGAGLLVGAGTLGATGAGLLVGGGVGAGTLRG